MKRLILIAAILYCVSPDLFAGPVDDILVMLAGTVCSTVPRDRDPEFRKLYREY
ncbi:MAG: hypothetical protein IJI20_06995 [Firmicutes bacterium]|nr:hypothetical protein [Bacillota bacterium]